MSQGWHEDFEDEGRFVDDERDQEMYEMMRLDAEHDRFVDEFDEPFDDEQDVYDDGHLSQYDELDDFWEQPDEFPDARDDWE